VFVYRKVRVKLLFFVVNYFMHPPPHINLVFVIYMSSKTLVYWSYTRHQSMFLVAKLPERFQVGCQGRCSAKNNCSLRDWLIPLEEEEEEIGNLEPSINFITYHSTYIGSFDTNYIIFGNARGVPLAQLKRATKTNRDNESD